MNAIKEFLKPNGRKIIIFLLITVVMFGGRLLGIEFLQPIFVSLFLPVLLILGSDPGPPPIIVAPVFITAWILYFYTFSCLIYFLSKKIKG